MVDVDADRQFLQIMWGEGVAEEYKDDAKKCTEQHVRNMLAVNRGEMKNNNGDEIAVLACHPAPPGRRF